MVDMALYPDVPAFSNISSWGFLDELHWSVCRFGDEGSDAGGYPLYPEQVLFSPLLLGRMSLSPHEAGLSILYGQVHFLNPT